MVGGPTVGEGSSLAASCGVGPRNGWDLAWLWLRHRPAATAPIQPLAWEPPYAVGADLAPPTPPGPSSLQGEAGAARTREAAPEAHQGVVWGSEGVFLF